MVIGSYVLIGGGCITTKIFSFLSSHLQTVMAADIIDTPTPPSEEWEIAQVIGGNIASLTNDRDTVEIGTGTAAQAVMNFLADKNALGPDGELMCVQIVDLMKSGAITGQKKVDVGRMVSSCFWTYPKESGASEALEFITENPTFEFRDISNMCNVPELLCRTIW